MRKRTMGPGGYPAPGRAHAKVDRVIERAQPRRRASDFADARANRAAVRGDIVGLWVASGQADAARKRREEWARRNGFRELPQPDATPAD